MVGRAAEGHLAVKRVGIALFAPAAAGRRHAPLVASDLEFGFGSALNLNEHFRMLWLDGVCENVEQPQRKPRLHRTRAPTSAQLTQLVGTIAHRACRHLARKRLAQRRGRTRVPVRQRG